MDSSLSLAQGNGIGVDSGQVRFGRQPAWPVLRAVAALGIPGYTGPGFCSCRGLYQTLGQPSARHDTRRCPGPFACAALAGPQSPQGIQLTVTRPGPQG
jgi:hypothetical protein